MPESKKITQLLINAGRGSEAACDKLEKCIHGELRTLAGNYLLRESRGHTLQPTALVHEAYMRLVDQKQVEWKNRAQFFRVAARMMRRVLVDHARKIQTRRRSQGPSRPPLTELANLGVVRGENLIAIDEALEEFSALDAEKSRIMELRLFAGLPMDKVAQILGVSHRIAEQNFDTAQAWLDERLGRGHSEGLDRAASEGF